MFVYAQFSRPEKPNLSLSRIHRPNSFPFFLSFSNCCTRAPCLRDIAQRIFFIRKIKTEKNRTKTKEKRINVFIIWLQRTCTIVGMSVKRNFARHQDEGIRSGSSLLCVYLVPFLSFLSLVSFRSLFFFFEFDDTIGTPKSELFTSRSPDVHSSDHETKKNTKEEEENEKKIVA